MPTKTADLSAELLAGQTRLLELRKKFERISCQSKRLTSEYNDGRSPSPSHLSSVEITNSLPAHLGWGSEPFTAVIRSTFQQTNPIEETTSNIQPQIDQKSNQPLTTSKVIKLYPDLAIGLLEAGKEAAGRIWLLLRYLDSNGRGWLTIEEIKERLTKKSSEFRVCGWRQLRNLLNQGESLFWNRANGRIWLQSLTNVAASLHIARLKMRPVSLPIKVLTQTIGKVRAHFYASFHSSRVRSKKTRNPEKPISRTTITQITQIHKRTQRRYEKIARVRKQTNYAVAEKASAENIEAQSWQRGHACFKLTDYKGLQGKPGSSYVAWQLPNSYKGPHQLAPKGKQKRINQALSDLFMKGMTGNGQGQFERHYFANGRLAAKAFNRQTSKELYWYDPQLKIWHFLKN